MRLLLDEIKRHSKVAVNENKILFIFPSFSQVREATNRVVLNASDLEIRSVTCSGQGMRVWLVGDVCCSPLC